MNTWRGVGIMLVALACVAAGANGWAAAVNDVFENAIAITGLSVRVSGNNFGCTAETNEPAHYATNAVASVWWAWTSPPVTSNQVTIHTLGSDFDTVLAVYTGASLGSLTGVASNDDYYSVCPRSLVEFDAEAGATYYIAVDGHEGEEGNIALTVRVNSLAVSNETFSGRATVVTGVTVYADNRNAVAEPLMPSPEGLMPQAPLWWTWTAPGSCVMEADTRGSDFDTVLGVYTGETYGALSEVATNDDRGLSAQARVWFKAEEGVEYQIMVDGHNCVVGDITLDLREVVPPEIETLEVAQAKDAMSWQSITGETYRIWASSNLQQWAVATSLVAETEETIAELAPSDGPIFFYRISRYLP